MRRVDHNFFVCFFSMWILSTTVFFVVSVTLKWPQFPYSGSNLLQKCSGIPPDRPDSAPLPIGWYSWETTGFHCLTMKSVFPKNFRVKHPAMFVGQWPFRTVSALFSFQSNGYSFNSKRFRILHAKYFQDPTNLLCPVHKRTKILTGIQSQSVKV